MDKLFTPINLGNLSVKNRFFLPAMELGLADFSGNATDKVVAYYRERALGGAGLIITGITRVDDRTGATNLAQLSLSHSRTLKSLTRLVDEVHKAGSKIVFQLHHPGRQNVRLMMGTAPLAGFFSRLIPGFSKLFFKLMPMFSRMENLLPRAVSPSKCDIAYHSGANNRALTNKEIKKLISKFVKAAERAKNTGADGVELHMAHGYLLQQFLSPVSNNRTDEYGGDFNGRMRFITEIISGIQNVCGKDYPILVRLSVDECYEDNRGYGIDVGIAAAKYLENLGIAALDVSIGGYDTFNKWLEPMSQDAFCRKQYIERIREEVSLPLLAVDNFHTVKECREAIESGRQDMVGIGRPMIADPHFVIKAEGGYDDQITRCVNCLHCFESMEKGCYTGTPSRCSVNPLFGRENDPVVRDGDNRLAVVVGGGLSGLMAAFGLLNRGFRVTIFEKDEILGGQINLANKPPKKQKIGWAVEDLARKVAELGGVIKTGTPATFEDIINEVPYAVVLATGSKPYVPRFIKVDKTSNVVFADDVLLNKTAKAKKAIVIGSGMTGLECAEYLAENKTSVTIIEKDSEVSRGGWFQQRDDSLSALKKHNVKITLNASVSEITKNKVYYTQGDKMYYEQADLIVLCIGNRPERNLAVGLVAAGIPTYLVGDARGVGAMDKATSEGYQVAQAIK